ncbi:hypothetical protein ASG43_04840 [Aureimonas sp. Leaf454]|uniref:hypothetical protein n=1 Tax=Aureimonas sp. Leaf454 TaxID=1736381 RepID=UPI0007148E15|nr:hypothetical protein [Aureimonas sp. Leaf454]KQT54872.1 hypothetical protein ASG43_04840 [Aureimonas sp. Leaf454]
MDVAVGKPDIGADHGLEEREELGIGGDPVGDPAEREDPFADVLGGRTGGLPRSTLPQDRRQAARGDEMGRSAAVLGAKPRREMGDEPAKTVSEKGRRQDRQGPERGDELARHRLGRGVAGLRHPVLAPGRLQRAELDAIGRQRLGEAAKRRGAAAGMRKGGEARRRSGERPVKREGRRPHPVMPTMGAAAGG